MDAIKLRNRISSTIRAGISPMRPDRCVKPLPRGDDPFDRSGTTLGADGVTRYDALPESLVAMLRRAVDETPDVEAVAEVGGERVTYRGLWDRAARVAGGLRAHGVRPRDRVASRLPAGLDWVSAFFGTLMAGAVIVPVNTRLAEPEVEYVVSDSGSDYVFMPGTALPEAAPYVTEDLGPDDVAAIFYTSGTTGLPKGSLTTHAGFLTNCENTLRCSELPRGQRAQLRTLISVPLFHVTGCNCQLLTALYARGSSVVLPALDLAKLLALIPQERITFLVTVPAVYALALAHPAFGGVDVSGVTRVGYGGAPIAAELVHRIKAAFPNARVSNGFGMTETVGLLTLLPDSYSAEHADSVGFAVPVVDLALENPDPRTGVGELIARGPNITPGYWNKEQATKDAMIDGWLRTGDLACIEPNGLTYIVDRVKDMINRGGENVYCVEVENALAGAPGVAEAAVFGIADPVMGEKVGLVLVPAPGASVDVDAIIASLEERLADFKIPQYVAIRTTPLPRNPGGKILKRVLQQETVFRDPLA